MAWGDDALRFLQRVHHWPASENDAGLVNIHNTWKNKTPGGTPYWSAKAFRDPAHAVSHVSWLTQQQDALDIYYCTGLQAQTTKNSKRKIVGLRNLQNTLSSKVLFLDIDVKTPPKGYADLNEALTALKDFLKDGC